jgi:iron complex transport system substrate-binding protein
MAPREEKLMARMCVALLVWLALEASVAQVPAKRIISLVPALTEIVFAIGAGPQVVAVSSFDDQPPEVTRLPRVGALLDPDTERILSMRPDLVLIYGSQDALRRQLAAAGIAIFEYRHGGLPHVFETMKRLGQVTGHEARAATLEREIRSRLETVRARVAGRPRPRTLLVFGREPLALRGIYASGGRGFLHDLLELSGATNVFADVEKESIQASTELLLSRAPEVILELHYSRAMTGESLANERRVWDPLASIPAVKTNRVHLLVGDHLVVPGPRVASAAEELARAIHPEAFK